MLSVEQAWECIARSVMPGPIGPIPLVTALGSVLAEDVTSSADSPPFDKSMMDGYAVQHDDLSTGFDAGQVTLREIGEVQAGDIPVQQVLPGTALRIMTGAPLPVGADTVVPVEWTERDEESNSVRIRLDHPVPRGKFVIPQGQAMKAGELIMTSGTRLRAQEIALLAETGRAQPQGRHPPTVGILATGNELVEVDQEPGPGQIRNSNAVMLHAQVQQAGGRPRGLKTARDTLDELRLKIESALECDFLLLSGGVSMGDADLVPAALQLAGVKKVFHRVNVKPGKPIWFGIRLASERESREGASPFPESRRATYVFGLPGNPVSSLVCFELFVRLAFQRFQGIAVDCPELWSAKLAAAFEHRADRPTWFPAQVFIEKGMLRVEPVSWKGSSDLRSVAGANCSLSLPAGEIRWSSGTEVAILPWGWGLESGARSHR